MFARLRTCFASGGSRPLSRGTALLVVLLAAGVFFIPKPVHAVEIAGVDLLQATGLLIGNILLIVIKWLGNLLLLLMDVFLIPVASYNGFVSSPVVMQGWPIVRDLTNMFFVLMMLVISIGTILGIEEFSYRRLLPRLLIMAILINFSKVIVGVFVDFSQVVMLTFVNGFSAAAGGNLLRLLQIKEAVTITDKLPVGGKDIVDFVAAQALALIMYIISIVIVMIMAMMLAFRIVMIWILTILSPLAFFLSTFPRGKAQQAYAQWWDYFGNYLISGPVLAFFLWLSFSVTQGGGKAGLLGVSSTGAATSEASYFVTEAGSEGPMQGFIVGTALLLGGMYITANFGVAGGGMLRSAADSFKSAPARFARATGAVAVDRVKKTGDALERGFFARTGVMLPGTKRNAARKEQLLKQKEEDATNKGMRLRQARATFVPNVATQRASSLRSKANDLKQQKDAFEDSQKLRREASVYRGAAAGGSFVMGKQARAFMEEKRAAAIKDREALSERLSKAEDWEKPELTANLNKKTDELARLNAAVAKKDDEKVDWNASGLSGYKAEFQAKGDAILRTAKEKEAQVKTDPRVLDQEISDAERSAKRAEDAAFTIRNWQMRRPEARMMNAAIGKAESEAKDKLPANMTPQDRMDHLADAFERGDKFQAKVIMKKMAEENELVDALKGGGLGGKYGTDTGSVKRLSQTFQKQFGMREQDANRTLGEIFNTAGAKGATIFTGRFSQDAKSGAMRVNGDVGANVVQSKMIDKKSPYELFEKDNVSAMFNINLDADGKESKVITDAAVFKLGAAQDQVLDRIEKGKLHGNILDALKANEDKLRKAVAKGILSEDFVNKLVNAVAKKGDTASSLAAKYKSV